MTSGADLRVMARFSCCASVFSFRSVVQFISEQMRLLIKLLKNQLSVYLKVKIVHLSDSFLTMREKAPLNLSVLD